MDEQRLPYDFQWELNKAVDALILYGHDYEIESQDELPNTRIVNVTDTEGNRWRIIKFCGNVIVCRKKLLR